VGMIALLRKEARILDYGPSSVWVEVIYATKNRSCEFNKGAEYRIWAICQRNNQTNQFNQKSNHDYLI
jgi:hypothetical protein